MGGITHRRNRYRIVSVTIVVAALAIVLLISGCSTELLETVEKMVEFANRLDKVAPIVAFTTPNYGAQGVPQNISVTVTFDEAMDPDTITDTTFTVETSGTAQPGTVAYVEAHNMAVYTSTFPFYSTTVYTGRLSTSVRDASGNRLQSEYTWTFQTGSGSDTTRPSIDFRFPGISAMGMGINIDIAAGFDEPLDPTSVNSSTFGVWQGSGQVSGSVLYDDASSTVIFVPSANLQPNTTYTVKVSPEIRDLAGNTLGGTGAQWDFTTGATSDEDPPQIDSGTPPVPDQGDVNLKIDVPNNTVSITFDEAMNPETINNSTFTLETTQGPVEGTVGYVPSQYEAVFLPSRDLDYMTLHTATVSGAVEDVAGNQLGSSYSWSFYTVANDPGTSSVTANIVKVTDSGGKVSAYVLFTDQDGNAVTNLTKYHFNLREKVDPDSYSEISTSGIALGSSRESKSVLVLVDDTPSMNGQYIETLKMAISNSVFGSSLGQFDTAMIATFASPNPGSPRVMLYPPGVQAPGDGEFSSSQADLINYLNLITVFGAPYSAVHDAMGYGMEDMMGQAADDMRGINAVIAFTDASPAYYFDGAYNNSDVLNYASLNEILIYAIGEKYADPGTLPQYAALGYNTSGYYRYVSGPPEYQNAYDEVIDLIHSGLRYVYKITWFTGYSSGDLDIQIQANYSTQTGGDFNNTDTELNYTLP